MLLVQCTGLLNSAGNKMKCLLSSQIYNILLSRKAKYKKKSMKNWLKIVKQLLKIEKSAK